MKSNHPEYLFGFVKTCKAIGLDESAAAMLLDKARHQDYLSNSAEYKEGFQNTFLSFTKSASPPNAGTIWNLIKTLPKAFKKIPVGPGVTTTELAHAFESLPTNKKVLTVATPTAGVVGGAGYGAYNLFKPNLEKSFNRGEIPDLSDLKKLISPESLKETIEERKQKALFSPVYKGILAADRGLMDAPPTEGGLFGRVTKKKQPEEILGLTKRLENISSALQQTPKPTQYSDVADIVEQRQRYQKALKQLQNWQKLSANPYAKKLNEIEALRKKVQAGQDLTPVEMQRFRELSSQVDKLYQFREFLQKVQ